MSDSRNQDSMSFYKKTETGGSLDSDSVEHDTSQTANIILQLEAGALRFCLAGRLLDGQSEV